MTWKDFSAHCGLDFHSEICPVFFADWLPRREFSGAMLGPSEGHLDRVTAKALIDVLGAQRAQRCWFYFSTLSGGGHERLFRGEIEGALDLLTQHQYSPEYWWPEDRAWGVCTDFDLCFTILGGPAALISQCAAHPDLECLPVTPDTRVDSAADERNLRISIRQIAQRILAEESNIVDGAKAMSTLHAAVDKKPDRIMQPFERLWNALRDHPFHTERELWAVPLLAAKDAERQKVEDAYRPKILAACREILARP